MKLVNMKVPKPKKSDSDKVCCMPYHDGEKYPYGLQIRLEKGQIDKLPDVKKLAVGDTVIINGKGKITAVRQEERNGNNNSHSIEIQIEDIAVSSGKALGKMSMDEYKTARGKS